MLRYLRGPREAGSGRALFLDRDGVLNRRIEGGYVVSAADWVLLDMAIGAAQAAQDAGAGIVVVTNQGAIGRGRATEGDVMGLHGRLVEDLARRGVKVDAIYTCPHHPLAQDSADRQCTCRKPLPGMLLQAAADFDLDLRRCVLVGDQPSDLAAAAAAGLPASSVVKVEQHGDHTDQPGVVTAAVTRALAASQPA